MNYNNTRKQTGANKQVASIDLREIIDKVLKNWYWFAISIFACAIIAFLYLMTQPDVYEVETGILLRQQDRLSGSVDEMAMMRAIGFGGASKEIMDEIEVITSKTMTQQMIDTLGIKNEYYVKKGWKNSELYNQTPFILLGEYPNFNDTLTSITVFTVKEKKSKFEIKIKNAYNKQKIEIEKISDPFNTFAGNFRLALTGRHFDPKKTYIIEANTTSGLVDALNKQIRVTQANKRSNAIRISTQASCRPKAIDQLNTLVDLYNADAIADKNMISQNTKNFVDGRIKLIEKDLFNIEHLEEQYKKSNDLTDLQTDAKLYLQLASEYERSRVALESQLGMINYLSTHLQDETNPYGLLPTGIVVDVQQGKSTSLLEDKDRFQISGGLIPTGAGINDAALSAMIKEYNDLALKRLKLVRSTNENNPAVTELNQQLKVTRNNIVSSIGSTRKGIEISLNDVIVKDNLFKSKIKNVPTQAREYREITRQQSIKEALYLFLLKKQEEMALALASTTSSSKTLDRAKASTLPVAPQKMIILFAALLIGALLPLAVFYVQDILNNKVTGKTELKRLINVPIIGSIMQSKTPEKLVVQPNEISIIAEQFRQIRSNLRFMLANSATPNVILVTSSISGEGKTFCAINLAMTLALTKKKTVLIGMDIRSPKLTEYLNINSKNTGVSVFLSYENSRLDEITRRPDGTPGLDVITCGPIPPNPAELLMSERTDLLFEKLRENYDYVVVDSAPVGLVSDAYIINKYVDMSIFVVRAQYTPKNVVANVKEIHDYKKLNNMAILLNSDPEQNTYGYGKYYKTSKS
ncbi:MAG: polysaccharide biosynthesis tyrosine autokinase [Prevotellaceae bacterium]|jgi:capsular exopolysaccharide synthesis family protein|nr:polysaccharide biosynthesis tyrosine autokinase [Prevotellaceae bacterium]